MNSTSLWKPQRDFLSEMQ